MRLYTWQSPLYHIASVVCSSCSLTVVPTTIRSYPPSLAHHQAPSPTPSLSLCSYLTKRYDDLVRQVPLMAVHTAGRSSVPADIYTPPPLRAGGVGWHPEW